MYTRTCDLQVFYSVFGADLYYHKNCIQSYLRKYNKVQCSESDGIADKKMMIFQLLKRIEALLEENVELINFVMLTICQKLVIPDPAMTFLCTLFNFTPSDINRQESCDTSNEEEDDFPMQSRHSASKESAETLYQILFFNVHNGRKRTPLHIMNAEAIYNPCRSTTLISSFITLVLQ